MSARRTMPTSMKKMLFWGFLTSEVLNYSAKSARRGPIVDRPKKKIPYNPIEYPKNTHAPFPCTTWQFWSGLTSPKYRSPESEIKLEVILEVLLERRFLRFKFSLCKAK